MRDAVDMYIVVTEDGPYEVRGGVPLAEQVIWLDGDGRSCRWREGASYRVGAIYWLCRCGRSGNKPFCDGTHAVFGFKGTECASRRPYLEQAKGYRGPGILLTDVETLCAFARFCDAHGQIWNVIAEASRPGNAALVRREAGNCPSGRLVAWDGLPLQPDEPALPRSLGLVEDPPMGVSGPIWVRGGIPIVSADGTCYETRNRVTLCRCGASANKPFCDGTHAAINFSDEKRH